MALAFHYPTGEPFLRSAASLRRELQAAVATCDPQHQDPALSRMVLVGHSMGGLVIRSACHYAVEAGRPWLDKLMALYDKGPFTFGYTLDLDLGRGRRQAGRGAGIDDHQPRHALPAKRGDGARCGRRRT